jgi:hypothetical protein
MGRSSDWSQVVGVVGDIRDNGLDKAQSPVMYLPLGSLSPLSKIAVRTRTDPGAFADAPRREVQALGAKLPVFDVITMQWH